MHKGCLPYKVCTMAAERRLLEKPRSKFVVFHFMHIFLPQSTFAGKSVTNPSWVIIMQKMVSHNVKNKTKNYTATTSCCLVRFLCCSCLFTALDKWCCALRSALYRPHASLLPGLQLSASFSFKVTSTKFAFKCCGSISLQFQNTITRWSCSELFLVTMCVTPC